MAERTKKATDKNKKATLQRALPHSIEAEQSLLGCVLVDSDLALDILSELHEDDFYSATHKTVFAAMDRLLKKNKPVDFITVAEELTRSDEMEAIGGISYLTELNRAVPSSANWKFYFEIVKKSSLRRRLIHTCSEIIEGAYTTDDTDEALAAAESKIYTLNNKANSTQLRHIYDSISTVFGKLEKISKDPSALEGVPSGIKRLDKLTHGFHGGELIIVAGRPGMGKTSLAMNMVEHAALNKKLTCAVFSLEMSAESLAQRSLFSVGGVPMDTGLSGKLTDMQWRSLWDAGEGFSKSKIFIADISNVTVAQITAQCRRLKSKQGLDLVLIDYIQLMQGDSAEMRENRQQEVAAISRGLKLMARELDVPVLALSQLRRESSSGQGKGKGKGVRKPQLSDLRESGAIEQDADVVLMLYNPNEEETPDAPSTRVNLLVAKNRNGAIGEIELDWIGEIVRFKEADAYNSMIIKQFKENKKAKEKRQAQEAQQDVPPPQDKDILTEEGDDVVFAMDEGEIPDDEE